MTYNVPIEIHMDEPKTLLDKCFIDLKRGFDAICTDVDGFGDILLDTGTHILQIPLVMGNNTRTFAINVALLAQLTIDFDELCRILKQYMEWRDEKEGKGCGNQ